MDKALALSITLLMTCLCSETLMAAQVYKWIDEKGQVHYGQKKQNSDARQMQLKASPPADRHLEERFKKRDRMLEIYAEEREERKAMSMQAAEEQKKRDKNCEQARQTLTSYEQASRIYTDDAQGNQVNLTKTQRTEALKNARNEVKKFCS